MCAVARVAAMELPAFHETLGIDEPEELVRRICEEVAWVYRFDAERHEDGLDDQQTFGFNVYRHTWARVEGALVGLAGVRTGRPQNSFEIVVAGGARFHMYRGGADETFDIHGWELGATSDIKASLPANNEAQLSLFDDEPFAEEENLRELVIVHAGNAEQGLTGLWVGAPRDTRVSGSQWAWVLQLYRPDGAGDGARRMVPTPPVKPYHELGEPDLAIELLGEHEDEGDASHEGAA
jgi:hypothetical protein